MVIKKIPGVEKDWLRKELLHLAKSYGVNNIVAQLARLTEIQSWDDKDKKWKEANKLLMKVLEQLE